MKIVLNDENIKNDYGFRILNSGIDLSRIKNNNPVIYRHNDYDLAIGNINDVRIEGSELVGEVVFDTEDKDPFVQRLIGKYERGIMKAFSMGVMVYELTESESDVVATKSELYELSACTIQSHKQAVVVLNAKGSEIPCNRLGEMVTLSFNDNKIDFSIKSASDMDLKKLAAALGLPETATLAEIETAALSVKTELTAKNTELVTLKSGMVDAAIKEGEVKGFITDVNRESIKAMLNSNYSATKQVIDSVEMPKTAANTEGVTTTSTTLKAVLESNAKADPAKVVVLNDPKNRETWDYEMWSKNDSNGLLRLKSENKGKFEALLDAHRLAHT
jgi:hypothetical protein